MSNEQRQPNPKVGDRDVWRWNRRRNRAAGVDRYGRPLARVAGTNPRALGSNPAAQRPRVEERRGT